jgi:hypothetical protein
MNNNLKLIEIQAKRGWGFFEVPEASQEFMEAVAEAVEALTGEQTAITKLRKVYLYINAEKKWANGLIIVTAIIKGHETISEAEKERIKKALEILIKNKA